SAHASLHCLRISLPPPPTRFPSTTLFRSNHPQPERKRQSLPFGPYVGEVVAVWPAGGHGFGQGAIPDEYAALRLAGILPRQESWRDRKAPRAQDAEEHIRSRRIGRKPHNGPVQAFPGGTRQEKHRFHFHSAGSGNAGHKAIIAEVQTVFETGGGRAIDAAVL